MHFFAVIFKGRLLHLRFGIKLLHCSRHPESCFSFFFFFLFLIERQSKTVAGLRAVVMVARQELDRTVRNIPVLSSLPVPPRAILWPRQPPRLCSVLCTDAPFLWSGTSLASEMLSALGSCSCQTTGSASATHRCPSVAGEVSDG